MLRTIHGNRDEHHPEESARPELLYLMHKLRVAPMHGTHRKNSGENRQYQQYRPCYQILIDEIKVFHISNL